MSTAPQPKPAPLRLPQIAADPALLMWDLRLPDGRAACLRPLLPGDQAALASFYAGLRAQTRHFYDVPGEAGAVAELAAEQCAAIGRYDKLRLVLDVSQGPDAPRFGGIFEFSLDLVAADVERYAGYGLALQPGADIRYGLCLADEFQGKGNASAVQLYCQQAAMALGAQRLILWGGVYGSNAPAIAFYRRVGFQPAGRFVNRDGVACVDMILAL